MTEPIPVATNDKALERRCIDTIRTLAMDAVQRANSGHPGTPMALAPLAYHLFREVMRYDPAHPAWPDRDRFVLSCGHASMLQYAALHLCGFAVSIDELKNFRQWGSITAGHPEVHETPGVEVTTGPLGQGIAHAVGMALAETRLADWFNTEDHTIVDHFTYVIASDGDLMEGISNEASSLAGHLALGKLIVYYDDNNITIDGDAELSMSEDVAARYRALGWHVLHVDDATNLAALRVATAKARAETQKPTLVLVKSVIGFGSPNKAGKSAAHGAPLGAEEVALTKEAYGWPAEPAFFVPDEVATEMARARQAGAEARTAWQAHFNAWAAKQPTLASTWKRLIDRELPTGWDQELPGFDPGENLATRKASHKVLDALMRRVPEMLGGSADLAGSNGTKLPEFGVFTADDRSGRIVHFGVREHAMAAICAGASLHGGVRPFCATFLVFTDYMRPSIRLAALQHQPVIFIMTHDSIGLGEDGPTHQPIEHVASLRAIPNVHVLRPCDANETREAWRYALKRNEGPTVLVLTRQGLPTLDRNTNLAPASNAERGGYVLAEAGSGRPAAILMATGSEVTVALKARDLLERGGVPTRVVSMPCHELFLAQDKSYQDLVLPPDLRARVAIEAAHPMSWDRFVGLDGDTVTMNRFGASAPAPVLFEKFGFTADNVATKVRAVLARIG